MTDYADVPDDILAEMRAICDGLPETYEEQAWTGRRWRIRKRTFVHVFAIDTPRGPFTAMQFRSEGPELDVRRHSGHPFFAAGWGNNVLNML
ncbi:MAG: MmcQ/YjbR family DNA-binding protein, partial [Actinobacteria bacterium]|nr:MmcQ/YjbR family DNA-binding protein [Actinomycetota bacterium]